MEADGESLSPTIRDIFSLKFSYQISELTKELGYLEEFSDITIYGHTQPIYPNRIFGGTSRLALMIITRTIVEYMAGENDRTQEELNK